MPWDPVLKAKFAEFLADPVNSTQDLEKKWQTQTSPIFNAIQTKHSLIFC